MENKNKELTIIRVFDAPRELVWKAWTDPKLLAQWWGPNGVTNPICEFDAKPGGAIHIVMEAGEKLGELKGSKWPMSGVVKEVEEPTRIVYTSTALEDEEGYPNLENLVTVTFEELDGKTKLTTHIVVTKATPKAAKALEGMDAGWNQSIDKLAAFLMQK